MTNRVLLLILLTGCAVAPSVALGARGGSIVLSTTTYEYGPGDYVELYFNVYPGSSSSVTQVEVSGDDGFYWYDCYSSSAWLYDQPGDYNGGGVEYTAWAYFDDDGLASSDSPLVPPSEEPTEPPDLQSSASSQVFVQAQPPRPSTFVIFWEDYDNGYPSSNNASGEYTCNDGYCSGTVAGTNGTWYYNAHDQLFDQWGWAYYHQTRVWENMSSGANGCLSGGSDVGHTTFGNDFETDGNGRWWDEFYAFVDVWCQTSGASDCSFTKSDYWVARAPGTTNDYTLDVSYLHYSGAGFSVDHTCAGHCG